VEDYANLPDFRDSKTDYLLVGKKISQYFCWSHGVQRTWQGGLLGFTAPYTPEYPNDGRYPGTVMKELIKHKLDLSNIDSGLLRDLQNTANGFRAHNAADRKVHFSFFLGMEHGTGKYNRWVIHHGLKEYWAEYWNVCVYAYDGKIDKMFKTSGKIETANLSPGTVPASGPGFRGNAKLMRLAQLVCRKNRRRLGTTNNAQLTVESVGKIQDVIDEKSSENILKKPCWAKGNWEYANITLAPNLWKSSVKVWIWDAESESWVGNEKQTVDCHTPDNNKDEFYVLRMYALWSKQQFAPQYEEHGKDLGNTETGDDWRVWKDSQRSLRFDASVTGARQRMFTTAQLTPQNQ
jgi:hypothetical protein